MQETRRSVLRIIAGSAAITSTNVVSAESSSKKSDLENPNFKIVNNKTEDVEIAVRVSQKGTGETQLDNRLSVAGKNSKGTSQVGLPNVVEARLDLKPGSQTIDVLADGTRVSHFDLDVGPDGVPDYVTYSIELTNSGAEIAQELE